MSDKEQNLIDEAKRLLDESADNLDTQVLTGLARARIAALERQQAERKPWLLWSGLSSAAVATLAVLIFWQQPQNQESTNYVADMGILAAEESLEFYDEMEFYQWLSEVADEEDGHSDSVGDGPAVVSAAIDWRSDAGERSAERGVARISGRI